MSNPQPTRRRVTAGEALYVLDRLIKERRLKASEVAQLVAEMHREIEELERRLATLREATGSARTSQIPKGSRARRDQSAQTEQPRRVVTPELAKSRRLQGEYMGLIRHIQGPARARMKKLAGDQGREAAIKAMRASLTK
jgi:hypothetical protein